MSASHFQKYLSLIKQWVLGIFDIFIAKKIFLKYLVRNKSMMAWFDQKRTQGGEHLRTLPILFPLNCRLIVIFSYFFLLK